MTTRKWKSIQNFQEWAEQWCENCLIDRRQELAVSLLYFLPELSIVANMMPWSTSYSNRDQRRYVLIKKEQDRQILEAYIDGLYAAMFITLNDSDYMAKFGKRAVNSYFKFFKEGLYNGRLEGVKDCAAHSPIEEDSYWKCQRYRELPYRFLEYFSSSRSYWDHKELYKEYVELWIKTLLTVDGAKRKPDSILPDLEIFDWPDIQVGPYRTMFLRTLILDPNVSIFESLTWRSGLRLPDDIIPDYFDLLVDARKSILFQESCKKSEEPQGIWPNFAQTHADGIKNQIYRLGVQLDKSKSEIEL